MLYIVPEGYNEGGLQVGLGTLDGHISKCVGREAAPLCTPLGSVLGLVVGSMLFGPRALQECTLQEGALLEVRRINPFTCEPRLPTPLLLSGGRRGVGGLIRLNRQGGSQGLPPW